MLIVVLITSLIACAMAIFCLVRMQRVDVTQSLLHVELKKLSDHAAMSEDKLRRIVHRICSLEDAQSQLSLKEPSQQTYQHAVHLAKSGADIKAITDASGLSHGEAELIMLLHKIKDDQKKC